MSESTTNKNPPLHFAVPLFPSFQALDLFGPLDALNSIPLAYPEYAGQLRLSIIASTLDPISTLPHSSLFQTPTPTPTPTPASSVGDNDNDNNNKGKQEGQGKGQWTFEQKILPTHTFSNPPTDIDVILLPGGIGTRSQFQSTWQPIVSYLSSILYLTTSSSSSSTSNSNPNPNPNLRAIFTICTGSLLLAHTGILTNKSATTNKSAFQLVKSTFPNVNWKPKARWVKDSIILPSYSSPSTPSHPSHPSPSPSPSHLPPPSTSTTSSSTTTASTNGPEEGRKIDLWTCSGVSAGLDGIFAFLSSEFNPTLSQKISKNLEYEPKTDPNDDPFAVVIDD